MSQITRRKALSLGAASLAAPAMLGLALERATGVSLADQVRDLMYRVRGENTMSMGTDSDGVPMIGASLLSSPLRSQG